MKSYILLRNNKESGPYTLKDLQFFGINSNDLIWVEGKSTAWNYASEITELVDIASEGQKRKIPERLEMTQLNTVSQDAVITSDILETENDDTGYVPGQVSIYSSGRSRRRKSVNAGTNLFGFTVLLIGTGFCAFVVKKMVDGFDGAGFSATAEAKTIQEEVLSPSTSSHAARMGSTQVLKQPISDTIQVIEKPAPQKAILLSKTVLITSPAKEKMPVIKNAVTGIDGGGIESSSSVAERKEEPVEKANEEKETTLPPKPAPSLQVTANDYRVGIFGGISNLELSVTNPSSQVIDKAVVEVEFLKPNGSVVKSQTISVEDISPGSAKKIAVPSSNRGVKVRYKVVSVQSDAKIIASDI